LIIDDTALPEKGNASVGVALQYASALGKDANYQALVSVTLASSEVPLMLSLRLFLPESATMTSISGLASERCRRRRNAFSTKPVLAFNIGRTSTSDAMASC